MRICPALLCCLVSLLFAASFCRGDGDKVEVVGVGECTDCELRNIDAKKAFSGIRVSIDCLTPEGEYKRRGVGELNAEGKFKVLLPPDILVDGKSKEECYAQLHSAAARPCPPYGSPKSSNIVFKSITHGKHTYELADKLKFSPETCASAFLWPYFKHPMPKFEPPVNGFGLPLFPRKKLAPLPPKVFPQVYYKPLHPLVPIYKKPLPPLIPTYRKPLPPPIPLEEKPLLPFVPKFKKPLLPPIPIFKKPLPPPIPKFEKPIPISFPRFKKPLPPPIPIFKKPLPYPIPTLKNPFKKLMPQPFPIFQKPLPPPFPFFKPLPPFYKKPFPEIPPEQPNFKELPPFVPRP